MLVRDPRPLHRDGENRTTQIQQKRKLAKLREAQAAIMQRHAEAEKKFKAKNAELTEEYRRVTKQYKELQQKFRHFEAADQVKFQVRSSRRRAACGCQVVVKVSRVPGIVYAPCRRCGRCTRRTSA